MGESDKTTLFAEDSKQTHIPRDHRQQMSTSQLMRYGHTSTVIRNDICIFGGITYTIVNTTNGGSNGTSVGSDQKQQEQQQQEQLLLSHSSDMLKVSVVCPRSNSSDSTTTMKANDNTVSDDGSESDSSSYSSGDEGGVEHGERVFSLSRGQLVCTKVETVEQSNNHNNNTPPPQRNFHSAVVYDDCLHVFGGKNNGYFCDIHRYDPELNIWTRVDPSLSNKVTPSRRYGHTAAVIGNEMFIFGGYDSNGDSCNDLFAFHFGTREWRELKLQKRRSSIGNVDSDEDSSDVDDGDDGEADANADEGDKKLLQNTKKRDMWIRGRYHHVMSAWNNRYLMIHGGMDGQRQILDDLIVIDTETQLWHKVMLDGDSPSALFFGRYGHTGVMMAREATSVDAENVDTCGVHDHEFLVLGGYAYDRNLFKESFKLQFNQDFTRATIVDKYGEYDMTPSKRSNNVLPCAPLYCTANTVLTSNNETAVVLFGGTTKVPLPTTGQDLVDEDDNNSNESRPILDPEFIELVHQIPSDAALFILSFLTLQDWCNIRLVSKNWKFFEVTGDNLLWRTVFQSAIQHPRYDPIREKVLNKVNNVDNYRQKVILLRKDHIKYMSAIVKKRMASIMNQSSVPGPKHVYYGMDGLKNMFRKIHTRAAAAKVFGAYEYNPQCHYHQEPLDLKTQGNIKVVVIGDGAVGKTCLLIRSLTGEFPYEYIPTIFDNYDHVGDYWGPRSIRLWDTAGPEDYDRLRPLSYPSTTVFLVCFSVVNEYSFRNVSTKWLPEITHHCPNAAILLVGTKADLRDSPHMLQNLRSKNSEPITHEEAEMLAKHQRCIAYLETSSVLGINVDRTLFQTIVQASLIGLAANRSQSKKDKKCIIS